jgi:integration host factor subunit beta
VRAARAPQGAEAVVPTRGKRGAGTMTKSELIERIAQKQSQLAYRDVELAVKTVLEHMADRLASGERIEIRGFGSFSLHFRPGRVGRNPKTGAPVALPAKHVPHFKPGKELRERVDGHAAEASLAVKADESESND